MTDTREIIIVKVGTTTLTGGTKQIDRAFVHNLARQIVELREQYRVILVTSAAIAAGREQLNGNAGQVSESLISKQMLAALGMPSLMQIYANAFAPYHILTAQALLAYHDFNTPKQRLNARNTLLGLLERGILPIVNENDVVATEEITFGDNDRLSALVAELTGARKLVILTDTQGLYTANPRLNPDAQLVRAVAQVDDAILAMTGGSVSGQGSGGMLSKVLAAKFATEHGIETVITQGIQPDALAHAICGEATGTYFAAQHLNGHTPGGETMTSFERAPVGENNAQNGTVTERQERTNNPLAGQQIAFIGAGVMAEAMISGLLERDLVMPGAIYASHPRGKRAEELEVRFGIHTTTANVEAARSANIIVLCVKPQRLDKVLGELKGQLNPDQLVISIIAGASAYAIARQLHHEAVVRVMPNTPAQIGHGISVWTNTPAVTETQQEQARALLRALGKELWFEEERFIDMGTAINGSGPAYIFLMMEAMIDAAVHLGFSRHDARELVMQTLLGSVLYAEATQKHPAELRNMVTSPGGTSAEALYQLEKGGMRTVLSKAIYAAYQKTFALNAMINGKDE